MPISIDEFKEKIIDNPDFQKSVQRLIPAGVQMTAEALLSGAYVSVINDRKVLNCGNVRSVILQAAQLGLPFRKGYCFFQVENKKDKDGKWINTASLGQGLDGLKELAFRTEKLSKLETAVVYENDHFVYDRYPFRCEHTDWFFNGAKDPGNLVGAWVEWTLKDGNKVFLFAHVTEIEKRRAQSPSYKSDLKNKTQYSPWSKSKWEAEMFRATVVKMSLKSLPSGGDLAKAIEFENQQYDDVQVQDDQGGGPVYSETEQEPDIGDILDEEPVHKK